MRRLRAVLLLLVLTAGFPVALALTIGNPLDGWDGLRAGDVSDDVLLDVLAAVAWVAWACFVWDVIAEILILAAGFTSPRFRGVLPGTQHLAHALVTAVFLVLPSTAPVLGGGSTAHVTPTATLLHTTGTNEAAPAHQSHPPGTTRQILATTPPHGAAAALSHRAVAETGDTALSPSQVGVVAGIGFVAGVSMRELARLRRRQWRHRTPGRAIPSTPPAVAVLEKSLTRHGIETLSAAQRAEVLAARANTQDEAMAPARGQAPWDTYADATGALIPQFTLTNSSASQPITPTALSSPNLPPGRPPGSPGQPGPANPGAPTPRHPTPGATDNDVKTAGGPVSDLPGSGLGRSVLGPSRDTLLTATASTARDVQVLAPQVPEPVSRLVRRADPDLDEDLAEWHSPHTTRPRLSLLGQVHVRASGSLPSPRPRLAWHTEVTTYLAAHPRGVTPEKFGADLWPDDPDITSKPKLRGAIFAVRRWLAINPATGQAYLPQTKAPNALYRIEGLLSDAELFRRLRLRGITRGPQGIRDLETALDLVTGPPLDPAQRRRGGYGWLIDATLDAECTAMIIDVAHLVATHHLSTGRPDLAALAAQTSLTAGSRDDIPLLDLVAASDAQGHHAEATKWIKQILNAHDTDIEEDLPPRTAEILHRRRWHQAG
jgi:hypothetical protein